MKPIFFCLGVIAVLFAGACNSNKQLSQANAEKAINTFASTHSVVLYGGGNGCSFNPQSIASIAPLSQFSDAEATTVVALRCKAAPLPFKFVFQKDVNNQWFLTKITQVEGYSYYGVDEEAMIRNHQALREPAQ